MPQSPRRHSSPEDWEDASSCHRWTRFETDIVVALICKGDHRKGTATFATKLNRALNGKSGFDNDIDLEDVEIMLARVTRNLPAALKFIERQPGERLTRVQKQVFYRALDFDGSWDEWNNCPRRKKVREKMGVESKATAGVRSGEIRRRGSYEREPREEELPNAELRAVLLDGEDYFMDEYTVLTDTLLVIGFINRDSPLRRDRYKPRRTRKSPLNPRQPRSAAPRYQQTPRQSIGEEKPHRESPSRTAQAPQLPNKPPTQPIIDPLAPGPSGPLQYVAPTPYAQAYDRFARPFVTNATDYAGYSNQYASGWGGGWSSSFYDEPSAPYSQLESYRQPEYYSQPLPYSQPMPYDQPSSYTVLTATEGAPSSSTHAQVSPAYESP